MIPGRTAEETSLSSLQPAEQPTTQDTVEVKRNKFLASSAVSAVIAALSLISFPGDPLFAGGKWIRIITLPLVASYIEVPVWSKQAFAIVYFGLLLLTIVFLLLAWKYHRMEKQQPRLGGRRNLLRAAPLWVEHVIDLTGAKDNAPKPHKST
jgi:hypothetical protein